MKQTLLRTAAVSIAVLVTATACGGDDASIDTSSGALRPTTTPFPTPSAAPTPRAVPSAAAPTTAPAEAHPDEVDHEAGSGAVDPAVSAPQPPDAPPGDPGPDAPEVPDPGAPTEEDGHGHEPLAKLPVEALLDVETLGAVVPGQWVAARAPEASCAAPVPAGAAGIRSISYRAEGGAFTETVATYAGTGKADAAVAAFGERLTTCGWSATKAPNLGFSSVQATRGAETVLMVVGEDGVTVVVRGSGTVTADKDTWEGLADLAMGSSCPAAADGCH